MRKVLFIGLGSAGQRHLRNLLQIFNGNLEIMAYRHHKSERVFDDNLNVLPDISINEQYSIIEYMDYNEALQARPDFVVIATPNNKHMEYAIQAAQQGIDIFIEKPLSVSEDGVDVLQEEVRNNHIVCQIGFQHRYNPAVIQMKKWILQGAIGTVVSVDVEIGERIENMHFYEDYREMVEARKDLGGGVVLCQCHEIDILFWLFGYPHSVYCIGGTSGGFDIDVEDTAESLLKYYDAFGKSFSVRLHQDFIQCPAERKFKVVGTKGAIQVDMVHYQARMTEYRSGKKDIIFNKQFKRNEMFLSEMREFINCVESRNEPMCNISTGRGSLKIGIAIKESMRLGKEVVISDI